MAAAVTFAELANTKLQLFLQSEEFNEYRERHVRYVQNVQKYECKRDELEGRVRRIADEMEDLVLSKNGGKGFRHNNNSSSCSVGSCNQEFPARKPLKDRLSEWVSAESEKRTEFFMAWTGLENGSFRGRFFLEHVDHDFLGSELTLSRILSREIYKSYDKKGDIDRRINRLKSCTFSHPKYRASSTSCHRPGTAVPPTHNSPSFRMDFAVFSEDMQEVQRFCATLESLNAELHAAQVRVYEFECSFKSTRIPDPDFEERWNPAPGFQKMVQNLSMLKLRLWPSLWPSEIPGGPAVWAMNRHLGVPTEVGRIVLDYGREAQLRVLVKKVWRAARAEALHLEQLFEQIQYGGRDYRYYGPAINNVHL